MPDSRRNWPIPTAILAAMSPIVALAAVIYLAAPPACSPKAIAGPLPAYPGELDACRRELALAIDTYSETLRRMQAQEEALQEAVAYIKQCVGGDDG